MLVVSRKKGETIHIFIPGGTPIVVTLVDPQPGKVRIGVQAPREILVLRGELVSAANQGETPCQP